MEAQASAGCTKAPTPWRDLCWSEPTVEGASGEGRWEKLKPIACSWHPVLSNARYPISCLSALRITRKVFLSVGHVAEGGSVGETTLGSDEPTEVLCAATWVGWLGKSYWPSVSGLQFLCF